MSGTDVWAAGGLVWRPTGSGTPEVLVVHRPRYDDWTLPKGKQEPDEPLVGTAVREVAEETGLRVRLDRPLVELSYPLNHDPAAAQTKRVKYWSMALSGAEFVPNEEVDQVRWVSTVEARELLTHGHDGVVLDEFETMPMATATVLLVRHARAGRRVEWDGPDRSRPLDPAGENQAAALVDFLGLWSVDRVVSAAPERCQATVRPLAESIRLEVEVDDTLSERHWSGDPTAALHTVQTLAALGGTTVACSQGGVIPSVIHDLLGNKAPGRITSRKGSVWALSIAGSTVLAAEYHEPA